METLEGKIKHYLAKVNDRPFLDDGIPDLFKNDPEKAYILYLFKLLDLLASNVNRLVRSYGTDAVYRSLIQAALGGEDKLTEQIMRDHFEELLPGQEDIFGTVHFDEYIHADSTGMWERVLLFLGVSPKYADILSRYFGDYGLVSLGLLIKALATGEIDFDIIMQEFLPLEETKNKD